jgi:hypothetical protein
MIQICVNGYPAWKQDGIWKYKLNGQTKTVPSEHKTADQVAIFLDNLDDSKQDIVDATQSITFDGQNSVMQRQTARGGIISSRQTIHGCDMIENNQTFRQSGQDSKHNQENKHNQTNQHNQQHQSNHQHNPPNQPNRQFSPWKFAQFLLVLSFFLFKAYKYFFF